MNNKKIISEIKRISRKEDRAMENLGLTIARIMLFGVVAWFVIFSIGTAFYVADNLFYLKVDDFNAALMKKIPLAVLIACAFTFAKIFVYECQKDSLKKVMIKRKKKVVR